MPDDDVPWLLLERYCAGTCTREEQAALDTWVAGDARRRLLVERLRSMFDDTPPTPDQAEIERAWSKLATTIDSSRSRTSTIVTLVAVGALCLLGVAWLIATHSTH